MSTDSEFKGFVQGELVIHVQAGWEGQVINFRVEGFNEPEYLVRIWTGTQLLKEWFAECELAPKPGDEEEPVNYTENVVDLATARAKGAA